MYGRRVLCTEQILSKITDYDIFRYYLPEAVLGEPFCSPLRDDKAPTCKLQVWEGKVFYKDFGTGDSYDCFSYVGELYKLSFKEALKVINNDFRLGLTSDEYTEPSLTVIGYPDKSINLSKFERSYTTIKVRIRSWEARDKNYWQGKYEFTSKQLEYFGCYPLECFWVDDHFYTPPDICYGYYLGKEDGREIWKIYRPLEDKQRKWKSNTSKRHVQGYEQLPAFGERLYITSSLKDVMTLRKLGLHAIAPSSESSYLPEDLLGELKARFNDIIVFYDNDEPGIKCAKKHSEAYNMEYMHIPLQYEEKDPSDFVNEWDYSRLTKILEEWDTHFKNKNNGTN